MSQSNYSIKKFKEHSLRVMLLSSKLARHVGCYDKDMRIGALLHDIGKIGISEQILFKPGRLNEIEYIVVQGHSHIGNTIVRKYLNLKEAAKYVLEHHECWDGNGYPRRLKGDLISIQGRIISICDAFDTMTVEKRNYNQQTLSFEDAFAELRRCSWTQFDGDLVETFISIVQNEQINKQLGDDSQIDLNRCLM